jgi:hypothetical protein
MTEWARKVRTGESLRIPAAAYNAFVDAAVAARRGSLAADAGNRGESSTRILAINTGATPIPRWHGCVIDAVAEATTVADGRVVVEVKADASGRSDETKSGLMAVAPAEIAPGAAIAVVVAGTTIAAVLSSSEEFEAAGFRGEFEDGLLAASASGPVRVVGIVDEGTSSTPGYAVVRLGEAPPSQTVLAEITDYHSLAEPNRWEYSWQEVAVVNGGSVESTNNLDSTGEGRAYNLCELVNDGEQVEGPGWDLDNAPGTFAIQPIQKCVVQLRKITMTNGNPRWVFFAANVLDGECEEEGSG